MLRTEHFLGKAVVTTPTWKSEHLMRHRDSSGMRVPRHCRPTRENCYLDVAVL